MNTAELLRYYCRDDVREALMAMARGREVVGVFKNGSYDRRPNSITNTADIEAMARSGAVEFHCSVERWNNVMALSGDNYALQRRGWDLILDLDCKSFSHAKIAAAILISEIKRHDIESVSVKFSGNKGFHIAIPFESFPKKVNASPTEALYPDLARKIILYLKERARKSLSDALLKNYSMKEILEEGGKKIEEATVNGSFDPFRIIEIDPILISPRHLFRMPYSINMKTFLTSLPIDADKVMPFEKEMAKPDIISADAPYIRPARENESSALVAESLDFSAKMQERGRRKATVGRIKRNIEFKKTVKEEFFPPCMKLILNGLSDGRKRALFVLINFLSAMKWSHDEIEGQISRWNSKNRPPLPESYVRAQLRYHMQKGKVIPPPACTNEAYYLGFNVCQPDHICVTREKMRNPARYPYISMKQSKQKARADRK
ncbi:MAG: hypothetical protein HYX24_00305 [Candidatus Aenigmarchaeota archaeon]|nr:hypothetical protein [Candidatus Aenigmarchaeota archaeon]